MAGKKKPKSKSAISGSSKASPESKTPNRSQKMSLLRAKFLGSKETASSPRATDVRAVDSVPHATAEQIAQARYPTKHIVQASTVTDVAAAQADSISSDVQMTKRKYGRGVAEDFMQKSPSFPVAMREDTAIVNVVSNDSSMDAGKMQPKGIVISDGVEIGQQG